MPRTAATQEALDQIARDMALAADVATAIARTATHVARIDPDFLPFADSTDSAAAFAANREADARKARGVAKRAATIAARR